MDSVGSIGVASIATIQQLGGGLDRDGEDRENNLTISGDKNPFSKLSIELFTKNFMLERGLQQTECLAGGERVDIALDHWLVTPNKPEDKTNQLLRQIFNKSVGIRMGSRCWTR